MEAFQIQDLTFCYPQDHQPCLQQVSFSIQQGQFLTLCGPSGGGKTTLLRQLKPVLTPHGTRTGTILWQGRPLEQLELREQSAQIGFVQQSPDHQLVTDKVWHELAFGLESLGYDSAAIRSRVAEMASFFGIESWFYQPVTALSGGQKQLLNLAAVMVIQPSVLILDEPTSQLDPIAAADFLAMLGRIHRELGTTILLTEQRLEEVFPLSDRVLVLDNGRLIADGTPQQVGSYLQQTGQTLFEALPTPMRVWAAVPNPMDCPVTVRDGRTWLTAYAAGHPLAQVPPPPPITNSETAVIQLSEIWFRYEKNLPDILKGLSLTVKQGEFFALMGGNGAGKTTALNLIGGLCRAQRGQRTICGTVGMLPQNPQALFVKKTVRENLRDLFRGQGHTTAQQEEKLSRVAALCRLEHLLDRHPYDLSGGEQQRAALAKVLLLEPDILLLDEPTKGLDPAFKRALAAILQALLRRGVTICMVSHDVEFCAQYAHRCALFFDGSIVTQGTPRAFFSGNSFYTTAANRMAHGILPEAITAGDIIAACGAPVPVSEPPPECLDPLPHCLGTGEESQKGPSSSAPKPLPLWRRILAGGAGLVTLVTFIQSIRVTDLSTLLTASGVSGLSRDYLCLYALLIGALLVLALAVSRRDPTGPRLTPSHKRARLPKRTLVAAVLILLLIPLTIFVGNYYLDGRKYYFIALLILFQVMLPFFLLFEGRKPQARELMVVAVLCALGIAGRAAFFMLPNFKPVIAIVILAGVAFGGETGFLVGAVTMLCSNVLFGQGPWTPWQMFAMGLIGFLAGIFFRPGWLRRTRGPLCLFGALAAILLYGGIMNAAAALMWSHALRWELLLPYYLAGFPVDLVQALATALFLWFGAQPMLEKLERVKIKYGLVS